MKKTILNPLLALAGCLAAFSGTSTLQAQTNNIWNFSYTGSIVQWTVPSTGYYNITAYGAQGGGFGQAGSVDSAGGFGAQMTGTFQLTQGEVLNILVGGSSGGGGGGGSFVVDSSTNPLVVAGGGGGGGSLVVDSSTNPLVVAGGGGGGGASSTNNTFPFIYSSLVNASVTTSGNSGYGNGPIS